MNKLLCITLILHATLMAKTEAETIISKPKTLYVSFEYKDTPLATIISDLATKKNINIVIPMQGPDALVTQVNYKIEQKIPLEDAWNIVIALLNLAGYSLVPHADLSYIIKNDPANSTREAFPLYINTPLDTLSKSDMKIRYILYIKHLQVPASGGGQEQTDPLTLIFKDLLSSDGVYYFEPQLNALIITDKSRIIRSTIELINALDEYPIKPHFDTIQIKNASADYIKNIVSSLIGVPIPDKNQPQTPTNTALLGSGGFFSKSTKIILSSQTNSLFLMGKKDAIERLKKFITDYLDKSPDSGDSILHVYQLQYLNAVEFAQILQSVLSASANSSASGSDSYGSGTGQSSSSSTGGAQRFFKGVIIKAEDEASTQSSSGDAKDLQSSTIQSGNRLFIAATNNDFQEIKKFIAELDIPQQQVFIHTLVVDMSLTGARELATQLRTGSLFNNISLFPDPSTTNPFGQAGTGLSSQTSMINGIEEGAAAGTSPTHWNALNSNLLPKQTSVGTSPASQNAASLAADGSFFISLANPKTDGVALLSQMLCKDDSSKILTEPLVVTTNNKPVVFTFGSTRFLNDQTSQDFGVTVQNIAPISATYKFQYSPTISENGSVNLSITVEINDYEGSTDNTQINRALNTVANIKNGDILVLGGMTSTSVTDTVYKVPVIGDIPLLGNLFKSKTRKTIKSSLMIFIRIEIIHPKDTLSSENMNETTRKKYNDAIAMYDNNAAFIGSRDPITHWFFGQAVMEPQEKKIFSRFSGDLIQFPENEQPKYAKESDKQQEAISAHSVPTTEEKNKELEVPQKQAHVEQKPQRDGSRTVAKVEESTQQRPHAKKRLTAYVADTERTNPKSARELLATAPDLERTLRKTKG